MKLLILFSLSIACFSPSLNVGTETHYTRGGFYASPDCTEQIPARLRKGGVHVAVESFNQPIYVCYGSTQ